MFTGLIETVGSIEHVDDRKQARGFRIQAPSIASTLSIGDSVAVDGVCVTVESIGDGLFAATAVAETLERAASQNLIDLAKAFEQLKQTDFWVPADLLDERLAVFKRNNPPQGE